MMNVRKILDTTARAGIGRWIRYYNVDRPHSTFGCRTPDEVYAMQENEEKLAA
jgi:putative transposase